MRLARTLWVSAVFALPAVAHAQIQAREWIVTPRGGMLRYAREASIKNAPFAGVDAAYYVAPMFAIGTSLAVGRSNTRGEDFIAALNFGTATDGDTTLYFGVTQPVTMLDAAVNATVRTTISRFSPFFTGGVGVYTLYLNPQVSGSARRHSAMSMNLGGGVDLNVGKGAGIQLGIRDLILTKYKRKFLNPTDPRFVEFRFPEDLVPPPAEKSTLHNLQFSVGFSFRPAATGANTGADQ
jgi:hypothetical protein